MATQHTGPLLPADIAEALKGYDAGEVVARLLGHTTSRLVDTVYGHLDLGALRGAMELI